MGVCVYLGFLPMFQNHSSFSSSAHVGMIVFRSQRHFFSFLIVFFFPSILDPPRPNRKIVCLRILQNRPGDRERE